MTLSKTMFTIILFRLQVRLHKSNSMFNGTRVKKILVTTTLRIILLDIFPKSNHSISAWIISQLVSLEKIIIKTCRWFLAPRGCTGSQPAFMEVCDLLPCTKCTITLQSSMEIKYISLRNNSTAAAADYHKYRNG